MTAGKFRIFLAILFVVACLLVSLLPILGRTLYFPSFSLSDTSQIYTMRFFRTLLAFISGGSLALAGLVFQSLFRNPLATPYTLGVASGASLGAAVCMRTVYLVGPPLATIGWFAFIPWTSVGAFLGAMLAMGIVYLLARYKDTSSEQMLLAGVAVNFFFASMIVFLQYISAPHDALQMLRWTMGGVHNAVAADCRFLGPVVLGVFALLLFQARELNVIVTGNERALSLGVDVMKLRAILFFAVSFMTGAVVAVAGPIGFVGLMVPHVMRIIVGPDHQRLTPTVFLAGGVFLALCDTLGRVLFYPSELPVGILTSLLGGPFFLWLLLRSERRLG